MKAATGITEVSIFKTSVNYPSQITKLKDLLDVIIGNGKWIFDLEDCDRILRIESDPYLNNFLVQEINKLGYECNELF